MALTLYVDTARWRAHHKQVSEQFPGLVPVCKGNGYGFGHERLADEATRLGSDILAVGTTYEAARIKDWFGGDKKRSVTEEVLGLGTYGRTLTVLTADEIPDPDDDEEDDDDVRERWTPRFRR